MSPSEGAGVTLDHTSLTNTGITAVSSLSWNHTIGSGNHRFLVVGIADLGTNGATSVTFGSQQLTLGRREGATATGYVELWYLFDPIVGTDTITVNLSGTDVFGTLAVSYFGVMAVMGTAGDHLTGTNMHSSSLTTTNTYPTEVVVDIVAAHYPNDDPGGFTPIAGQNFRTQGHLYGDGAHVDFHEYAISDRSATGSTTVSGYTWSHSVDKLAMAALALASFGSHSHSVSPSSSISYSQSPSASSSASPSVSPSVGTGAVLDAVGGHSTANNFDNPLTWTHVTTSAANRYLLVGVFQIRGISGDYSDVQTVTYGSQPMFRLRHDGDLEIWGLFNPTAGSHTVSIQFNGVVQNQSVGASISYSNVSGVVDADGSTGTSANSTVTVKSNLSSQVVDFAGFYQNGVATPTGTQTQRQEVHDYAGFTYQNIVIGDQPAQTPNTTATYSFGGSLDWQASAITIQSWGSPSPSVSPSFSLSPSSSKSASVSPSASSSGSPSVSPSASASESPSVSASVSPSVSPSKSVSPSASSSVSKSVSPSVSQSASPSVVVSASPSASASVSPSFAAPAEGYHATRGRSRVVGLINHGDPWGRGLQRRTRTVH